MIDRKQLVGSRRLNWAERKSQAPQMSTLDGLRRKITRKEPPSLLTKQVSHGRGLMGPYQDIGDSTCKFPTLPFAGNQQNQLENLIFFCVNARSNAHQNIYSNIHIHICHISICIFICSMHFSTNKYLSNIYHVFYILRTRHIQK